MTGKFKQKAKDFIDRINKESGGMWLNNYYLSDLLVIFATEATKELQEENAELKKKCYKKAVKDYCKLEKQNKELQEENERLAKHILELQKDKGRLTDELTEAKELLRFVIKYYREDEDLGLAKKINDAEAFINKE